MLNSTARAMLACAIVAALPGAALAQFGYGPQGAGGCTDGSCASQPGRPALFGSGNALACGTPQGSLFCGDGAGGGCDTGCYDSACGAVAYSLNGVDLYSYDRQDPWLHGQFQRLPAYGGYNSFRPYNYRHVLAQQQVATTRGDSDVLPYSQQFWNSYRVRYLNRHLSEADSQETDTHAESTGPAVLQSEPNPVATAGNKPTSDSPQPQQPMVTHSFPMQMMPSQMVPVSHANQPVPQQMMQPQQHMMMMQPLQQQHMQMMPQQMMMMPQPQQMMQPEQQMMLHGSVMAPEMMLPEQTVPASTGMFFPQSEMYPQNSMSPQEGMVPQPHMVIPPPAGNSVPAPAMVIPTPQQSVMHQVSFGRSVPVESAQPLIKHKTMDVPAQGQKPQPIHIYGSAILSSEPAYRP